MAFDKVNINQDSVNLSFLGRGWAFPVLFNKNDKGPEMVADFVDIEQSLRILFGVSRGERCTQLEYGCDLMEHIFDPNDNPIHSLIYEKIDSAIYDFEPRIDLLEVNFDKSQFLDGVLKIEIVYQVRATNTRHNIVFPFYKNEGTSLPIDVV